MNMKNWVNEIINANKKVAMPIISYPSIHFFDNLSVYDIVTNDDIQSMCVKKLSDTFNTISVLLPMDLSVEAEAFGATIEFHNDDIPTVKKPIIENIEDVNSINIPKVGQKRTAVYLNSAKKIKQADLCKPVFAGMIGPFSLAARLFDITELLISLFTDSDGVQLLLDKCTIFLVEYAKAFKKAKADGIIIAEPAAGLLSPEQCDQFSSQYIKRIVETVQDEQFMVILHNCGNTTKLVSSMLSTNSMGLHFGNAVDMLDILPQVPEEKLVFGNIDPASVFKNGKPSDVYEKTFDLLEKTKSYKNFVISSGCDVPPATTIENIKAFFDAVEKYNDKLF